MMASLPVSQLILALMAALGSGGLLGAWLTYKREGPKTMAEANKVTAETIDMDWARFQKEIDRLTKRVEKQDRKIDEQDRRIDELEREVRACHEREGRQSAEVARLQAILQGEGEARQHAQLIVSSERDAIRKAAGGSE